MVRPTRVSDAFSADSIGWHRRAGSSLARNTLAFFAPSRASQVRDFSSLRARSAVTGRRALSKYYRSRERACRSPACRVQANRDDTCGSCAVGQTCRFRASLRFRGESDGSVNAVRLVEVTTRDVFGHVIATGVSSFTRNSLTSLMQPTKNLRDRSPRIPAVAEILSVLEICVRAAKIKRRAGTLRTCSRERQSPIFSYKSREERSGSRPNLA